MKKLSIALFGLFACVATAVAQPQFVAETPIQKVGEMVFQNPKTVTFNFVNKEDYELLPEGTEIVIEDLPGKLAKREVPIIAKANGHEIPLTAKLSDEDIRILLAGGRLNLK